MTDQPTPDDADRDLDSLLGPPPVRDDDLRRRIVARTCRRLRVRRWGRRGAVAGCFLLTFAAGLACSVWFGPRGVPSLPAVVVQVAPQPVAPPRPVSPADLERQAEAVTAPAESALLFREAGDRYLTEWGDVRSALRCYRAFLDQADAADLAAAHADTWLLVTLKQSRQKEDDRADAN